MSVTTLAGSNSFMLQADLHARVRDFLSEHGDMALERLDGEEASYDRMREAIESMPFLASKKLVVLRAPSSNKEFTEKAEKLLENVSETTDVILHEPKLDKRTAYAKYLQKKTDFHEYKELDGIALGRWLVEAAKQSGGSISVTDANYLIRRLGPNQQMLSSELQKLLTANKSVTKEIIDNLTDPIPQSSIFDLLEAAFAGNHKRMLELYEEQRRQNVEPQAIIGLLAWQLNVLAVCVWAGEDQSSQSIASKAKLNPYVVQKTMSLARGLQKSQVKDYIQRLLELDEATKTSAVQVDDALRAYLLSL